MGAHWNTLADELQAVIAERERRRAAAAQVNQATSALPKAQTAAPGSYLIEAAPSDLGTALVERCLVASEAIRVRRNAAYSHPASLTSRRSRVTFYPVAEQAAAASSFPFRWHPPGAEDVRGYLRLKSTTDPLPILVIAPTRLEREGELWAAVLLGYEALSVLPDDMTPPPRQTPTYRGRPSVPRNVSRLPSLPRNPSRRRLSPFLAPSGKTARAHWVTGHIRLLPEGWSCSSEAEKEAAKVGISLGLGETWGRPHARGLAAHELLTFQWRVPNEAQAIL